MREKQRNSVKFLLRRQMKTIFIFIFKPNDGEMKRVTVRKCVTPTSALCTHPSEGMKGGVGGSSCDNFYAAPLQSHNELMRSISSANHIKAEP